MPDPVTVSVEVARPRQEVFDHIDVAANHEKWLTNLYKDWSYEGPKRGVGAKSRAQVDAPAAREKIEIEVVESVPPERTVEHATSAHGKRETTGTYRLTELDAGHTRIEFELAWRKTPRTERMAPFMIRAFMSRALGKSMKMLAAQLEEG
jgi:uncharacterized protein YndB with AHSA1/START domain